MLSSHGKGFTVALSSPTSETHKVETRVCAWHKSHSIWAEAKQRCPQALCSGKPHPSPAWAFHSFYFTFAPFFLHSLFSEELIGLGSLLWVEGYGECTDQNSGDPTARHFFLLCLWATEINTKMKITPPSKLAHLMWAWSGVVANFRANPLYFSSTEEQTRLFFVLRKCSIN